MTSSHVILVNLLHSNGPTIMQHFSSWHFDHFEFVNANKCWSVIKGCWVLLNTWWDNKPSILNCVFSLLKCLWGSILSLSPSIYNMASYNLYRSDSQTPKHFNCAKNVTSSVNVNYSNLYLNTLLDYKMYICFSSISESDINILDDFKLHWGKHKFS